MPFKSEKQRKYLWANEPEIARDWTETYGSRVKKADGGRIGFYRGGNPHSDGPSSSGSHSRSRNQGGVKSHGGGGNRTSNTNTRDGGGGRRENYIQTQYNKPPTSPKRDPKDYGLSNKNLNRGGVRGYIDDVRKKSILKSADRNKVLAMKKMGIMKGFNPFSEEEDWSKNMSDADLREMAFDIQGIKDYGKATYNYNLNPSKKGSGSELLGRVSELKSDPTQATYNRLFPGPNMGTGGEGGGLPYIYPTTSVASASESSGQSDFDKYLAGLGGDYLVPIDYVQNRTRAATGGVMDIVDRESIIKTPDEEIVTDQMEEIEGQTAGGGDRGWQAQMLADEMAYDLYGVDFYDLSRDMQMEIYGKALHEIDEMLLGMAQGGRVPFVLFLDPFQ